jgi:hypothetical protein
MRSTWTVVVDGLDRPAEGVERLGYDNIARRDGEHRRGVGPVNILIGALLGLRQAMSLAGAAGSNPTARHVGGGKPGRHFIPPKS